MAVPRPTIADQMPIAMPSFDIGKLACRIDIVVGMIIAAPIPWSTRKPISVLMSPAAPQAADAPVNVIRPMMNSRLRPKRSASLPALSRSTANESA